MVQKHYEGLSLETYQSMNARRALETLILNQLSDCSTKDQWPVNIQQLHLHLSGKEFVNLSSFLENIFNIYFHISKLIKYLLDYQIKKSSWEFLIIVINHYISDQTITTQNISEPHNRNTFLAALDEIAQAKLFHEKIKYFLKGWTIQTFQERFKLIAFSLTFIWNLS